MIQKRLGQLAEGNEAWLKLVKADGRLHGRVTTNGAVTGRCTHSKPNLAQVPNAGSPYGKECRELFTVGEGKKLVGCDASGLELRCLAHYMARYDGGAYAKILLEEDIHTGTKRPLGFRQGITPRRSSTPSYTERVTKRLVRSLAKVRPKGRALRRSSSIRLLPLKSYGRRLNRP